MFKEPRVASLPGTEEQENLVDAYQQSVDDTEVDADLIVALCEHISKTPEASLLLTEGNSLRCY